ncbi:hypothetical protein D9M68_151930 [compost metagenome]
MNAEHYARTIQFALEYLGVSPYQVHGNLEEAIQQVSRLRLTGSGIYTLWIKTRAHEDHYVPTYIGYTSRGISTRLTEHARFGKIRELYTGMPDGASTANGVGIMALELPTPMARAMEAVFLETFDFAQNTADNLLSRALVPWDDDADLSEDAPMPESATDIEAFNDLYQAISDQLEALQELQGTFKNLKV